MGAYALFAGSGQIQVASAFEEPAVGTIGYEIYDFMGNAIGVCIALGDIRILRFLKHSQHNFTNLAFDFVASIGFQYIGETQKTIELLVGPF